MTFRLNYWLHIFVACFYASTFFLVKCQFPRACTKHEALALRECCPAGFNNSKCSESTGRGSCQNIDQSTATLSVNETIRLLLDDRARWPMAFYDKACSCNNNFDGVDCSKCKPGYVGEFCDKKSPLRIRRNIMSMSIAEIQGFVEVLDHSKEITSENYVILTTSFDKILRGEVPVFKNITIYNLFVWMHYYVSRDNFVIQDQALERLFNKSDVTLQNRLEVMKNFLDTNINVEIDSEVDYGHEGPAFLPWHRYFLLKWEEEIREMITKEAFFALPYWDWRDSETCDVCNDLILGGQDRNNRILISSKSLFSRWNVICTRDDNYLRKGEQCIGENEGPILRNLGEFDSLQIDGLPTSEEVSNALNLGIEYDTPSYDATANQSFRNTLEGFANPSTGRVDLQGKRYLHNAVHLFMNGTMSAVETSANDPVFFLHHSYIDSLFELWLKQGNLPNAEIFNVIDSPRHGHRFQDYMVPFFPLVKNIQGFVSDMQLGYVYDYIDDHNGFTTDEFGSTMLGDNSIPFNITGEFSDGDNDLVRGSGSSENLFIQRDVLPSKKFHTKKISPFHKLNNRGNKQKFRRRFRFKPQSLGEGGFSLDQDLNEISAPIIKEPQPLYAENNESFLTEHSSDLPLSQRFQNAFVDFGHAFKTMSKGDIVLLLIICLLLVGCVCACTWVCRSRSPRKLERRCCCCYGHKAEPEETFALLATRDGGQFSNKEVVQGSVLTFG